MFGYETEVTGLEYIDGYIHSKGERILLKTLCELTGVSGYEDSVTNYLADKLKTLGYGNCYIDKVGNLIFYVAGTNSKKKILVQAHIDEVGFQIISEVGEKQYSLKSLGNIKTWNAYQQRVVSSNGIQGIIYAKDAEHLKAYNYENLMMKTLCSSKKLQIGDVLTFDVPLLETDEYFIGKALDNRASCKCLFNAITECRFLKNDTYFCFSVQEEIGMRGARVLRSTLQPDINITIDLSGIGERNSLKLGRGLGIKISDSMGVSSRKSVETAQKIASENNIEYQFEVSDCGTSELIISNEMDNGCAELGISIPCDYLHCANTVVYKKDLESCENYLPLLIAGI